MIAVDAGFVGQPEHTLDIPHEPHDAQPRDADVASLYRALPPVSLSPSALAELADSLGMDPGA